MPQLTGEEKAKIKQSGSSAHQLGTVGVLGASLNPISPINPMMNPVNPINSAINPTNRKKKKKKNKPDLGVRVWGFGVLGFWGGVYGVWVGLGGFRGCRALGRGRTRVPRNPHPNPYWGDSS